MISTMRIIRTIFIVVALLTLGISVPVLAQEVPVTVNAPDTADSGSSFTASIDIGEVFELNAAQYDILFDPLVLQLDSVTDGEIDSTTISVMSNELGGGHWRVVSYMGTGNVTGSGYLAVLHFQAVGAGGTSSTVNITSGLLSSISAPISATWTGDMVSITTPVCGDVNDDDNVNMADVMILWYDIAEYPSAGAWTISDEWVADVNCDEVINMADVMILWYDIADYPSAGAWEINCCE